MGLYWLMPSARVNRRGDLEWVIIEELEMGLHPKAISAVLLLVLELLWRGYRVCLSTHSPHVLDVVWAIRTIQEHCADPDWLLEVFDARKTKQMKDVAEDVIGKNFKVYYFDRLGEARDISNLDPGSENSFEAGWGGLSEFSGHVNEIVAKIVNKSLDPPTEEQVEPAASRSAGLDEDAADTELPGLKA